MFFLFLKRVGRLGSLYLSGSMASWMGNVMENYMRNLGNMILIRLEGRVTGFLWSKRAELVWELCEVDRVWNWVGIWHHCGS